MKEILIKKRVLRISTRKPNSPYRVKIGEIDKSKVLHIYLFTEEESEFPYEVYEIDSKDILYRSDIYFKAIKDGNKWKIKWYNDIKAAKIKV